MNIINLKDFIIENIPNFDTPEILVTEGECFHYSNHWDKIQTSNKFKGAKIDKELDQTQNIDYLGEAKEDVGVVFAYENLQDARDEGFGLDIIKIKYSTAIKAMHKAEFELGEATKKAALAQGIDMSHVNTPHTILLLTTDIISFEYIEKAPE